MNKKLGEGFKLMPIKPTREMLIAGIKHLRGRDAYEICSDEANLASLYEAMSSAFSIEKQVFQSGKMTRLSW